MTRPLSAPLDVGFDYTRSLGPTLGRFLSDLRRRRVTGIRGSDGRVHVPPLEYDPVTAERLHEFVDVAATGVVRGWSWIPEPLEGQPLDRPFAWALVQLDGADTSLLHAVDAGSPDQISTGARVRARWRGERVGAITDIECFELSDEPAEEPADADDVTMVTTPVNLHYTHSASPTEDPFLRGLMEGRLIAQRCPSCEKVYFPPRPACPTDGVPTTDQIELTDRGTITTFCVVNVPFLGQRIPPPYVSAYVLLDGADIPFLHLLLGVAPEDVRMGMRVEAVWKPREEWGPTMQNIDHFKPSGEPDAPFDSYSQHL
ncbi:Zn-ribbon domain-containing OB-fold protein [Lentzea cavernae]|uniref:DNA-binding protein n=1 Tax=Lentzea cavernae TaxID=2020703 RepID=A0ABQ3LYG5_9PSEU|nr:OB-fold nucleic acid binding domain-containing protein [Lentzea cavernae]GHH28439.1 DNA-binding protein [Lentzea cavernae]